MSLRCRFCGDTFPDTIDGFLERSSHYRDVHYGARELGGAEL